MIQKRIRKKFSVGIWDVPVNQSALTKFFRILGISNLAQYFSFKSEISSCTKKYSNLQSFLRQVKSKHCCFFEQHMKYFNTQQATADEADLSINNPNIREIDDLQQDDFSEAAMEDLQEGFNKLDADQSSVNHFDFIANLLLEIREKYNMSTSAPCFIKEKLCISQSKTKMFANKILNVLHKDENFVQSYELRMTAHMVSPFAEACQKFTGQKSLSTYIKAKLSCGTKRTASRL